MLNKEGISLDIFPKKSISLYGLPLFISHPSTLFVSAILSISLHTSDIQS